MSIRSVKQRHGLKCPPPTIQLRSRLPHCDKGCYIFRAQKSVIKQTVKGLQRVFAGYTECPLDFVKFLFLTLYTN